MIIKMPSQEFGFFFQSEIRMIALVDSAPKAAGVRRKAFLNHWKNEIGALPALKNSAAQREFVQLDCFVNLPFSLDYHAKNKNKN